MADDHRKLPFFSAHAVILAVLATGLLGAGLAFYEARRDERANAEAEFARHATIRHTLIREIIGRYEDAMAGLRNMFALEGNVTRTDFVRATRRVQENSADVRAFEWVPVVSRAARASMEAAMSESYGRSFEFVERDANGRLIRAGDRPEYYPICYIEPLANNERALGLDLKTGTTRDALGSARETRKMTASGQTRLIQSSDDDDRMNFIMIWPVYHAAPAPKAGAAPEPEVFLGFVQGVMDLHAMIQRTRSSHPDTILDALFVDGSEQNPAHRVLHYLPQDTHDAGVGPTEQEFRAGLWREYPIPMGGRDWRVIYRPREGWIAEQMTSGPRWRAVGILLITGLLAGLVHTLGRRTQVIERIVSDRTAELSENRRQLSSLMRTLPGMAFRCRYDKVLTVLYASEGSLALTGHEAEDFISGRVRLRDFIHPDDLERIRAETRAGLKERREFEIEYRVRSRDRTEKWVLSRSRGVYDSAGKLEVFEGLVIDISAQKQAVNERIAIERKLLEGQKLESLGLLAGGIAHDFNNLLTGILGNAGLLRLALPPSNATDPQLRAIESASLRAAELCRQMLAYAGQGRFIVEPTDLSVLVEGMLPLLKISIGRGVRVHLELGRALPAVMADATQLRQIVMNLVINASDAIGDRAGDVHLTTGLMAADHALLNSAVAGVELPSGDYVFLEVRDTGCGMTQETLRKIFDPFFSTKFAGRGLGLAAVLGIVQGHHGALQVESTPGRGSTFRLLLPPVAQTPMPTNTAVSATPWARATRVLIIEDDETVRNVAAGALKSYGLAAEVTAHGEAGLAAFRENPDGYDVVLLDLIMPGLSGEETLVQLRAIKPVVAVLLMSGYSESDILTRFADPRSPLGFLHKPFTREMLKTKLREILG